MEEKGDVKIKESKLYNNKASFFVDGKTENVKKGRMKQEKKRGERGKKANKNEKGDRLKE